MSNNYRSLSITILCGRLGRDAAIRTMPNGKSFLSLSVATETSFKGSDGNWTQKTSWHDCLYFGNVENLAPKLVKGTLVYIRGYNSYKDVDLANGHKGKTVTVIADELQFTPEAKQNQSSAPAPVANHAPARSSAPASDAEIPF